MSNRRIVSVAAVATSATAYTGRADGLFSTNDQAKLKQAGLWPTAIAAPSAPTAASATAGNLQATVAFTAPSSLNGSTITSYTVTSSGGQTATGASSPIVVTGLTNGSTYTFTVVANSASGSSIASSSASALIPSVPAAPTVGTATATGITTATVAYTAPANDGGSVITSYTATSSPGSITGTLSQAGSGTITVYGLTGSTAYTFTVNATNSVGTSAASAASNSITTLSPPPTTIGQAYGGGFYAGQINVNGTQYYLIVAPKSSGEAPPGLKWGVYGTLVGTSASDGLTNSAKAAALGAAHQAAVFCEGLTIGGYSDWYLPAKNELDVLYYNLKPTSPGQTSAIGFRTGETNAFVSTIYWSSTEDYPSYAYYVQQLDFTNGYLTGGHKHNTYDHTRAVRRVAV